MCVMTLVNDPMMRRNSKRERPASSEAAVEKPQQKHNSKNTAASTVQPRPPRCGRGCAAGTRSSTRAMREKQERAAAAPECAQLRAETRESLRQQNQRSARVDAGKLRVTFWQERNEEEW